MPPKALVIVLLLSELLSVYITQGRSQDFLAGGALSGAKEQILLLASRVRRRFSPPIELRLWSGGAKPTVGD